MSRRAFAWAWIAVLMCLSSFCLTAAASVSLAVSGNVITARDSTGYVVWKRTAPDASRLSISPLAGGGFDLGDGTVVDKTGRAVSRRSPSIASSFTTAAATLAWDPLVTLSNVETEEFSGPVFDAAGNAWAVVLDQSLKVVQSIGASGAWQTPLVLVADANNGQWDHVVFNPQIVADHSGKVHVLYRGAALSGGVVQYQMVWFSYSPGAGWSGPTVLDSGPNFFQEIAVAVSAVNNVIVVFDREASPGENATWNLVYTASSGTWGAAQRISAPGTSPILQTIAANDSGSAIWLAFCDLNRTTGVYVQSYNSEARSFTIPQLLPRPPLGGDFAGAGARSTIPMTVDSAGRVTLAAQYNLIVRPFPGAIFFTAIWGYHTDNGVNWTATQLLPARSGFSRDLFSSLFDFNATTVSSSGQALIVTSLSAEPQLPTTLYGFRFIPGQGWAVGDSGLRADGGLSVAYLGTTSQAIVVYQGFNTEFITESVLYTGGVWGPPLDVPGLYTSNTPEAVTGPSGEVLLLFEQGTLPRPDTGLFATWLRP